MSLMTIIGLILIGLCILTGFNNKPNQTRKVSRSNGLIYEIPGKGKVYSTQNFGDRIYVLTDASGNPISIFAVN